ncbi:SMR family transporter [Chloroflexota bacterium]
MTSLALILVLLSALSHASWNLLAKRAINQEVFLWCALVSSSVLLLPLLVFLIWKYQILYPGWWFIFGTVVLHVLYIVFLGRSYARTDLSLAYPIARGMGPALVPIIGALLLKEVITPPAVTGIICVVVGIFTVYSWGNFNTLLHDPLKIFRESGGRYALLTGLTIAAYSIWDKVGVRYVNPFLYMYFLGLGSALFLMPYIWWFHGISTIRFEIRKEIGSIILSGLLMFLTYSLILFALQFSRVSYIASAREVGIVVGVVLGTLLLREPFGKGRTIGSCLIIAGLVLISLAP